MKMLVMICILTFPILGTARTHEYERLLSQLDGVAEVSGSAIGAHGTPGTFYSLSREFLQRGTDADFYPMLVSTNAMTRLMGVYCILNTHTNPPEPTLPVSMFVDTTKVRYAPGGCSVMTRTVSDIVKEFIGNPGCLGPSHKEK